MRPKLDPKLAKSYNVYLWNYGGDSLISIGEDICLVWKIGTARINEINTPVKFMSVLSRVARHGKLTYGSLFSSAISWALKCFLTVIG